MFPSMNKTWLLSLVTVTTIVGFMFEARAQNRDDCKLLETSFSEAAQGTQKLLDSLETLPDITNLKFSKLGATASASDKARREVIIPLRAYVASLQSLVYVAQRCAR